jgi:hypothetical protein
MPYTTRPVSGMIRHSGTIIRISTISLSAFHARATFETRLSLLKSRSPDHRIAKPTQIRLATAGRASPAHDSTTAPETAIIRVTSTQHGAAEGGLRRDRAC